MAEQTQTTELASKPSTNTGGGLISNIGDTLEKLKDFLMNLLFKDQFL